MPDDPFTRSPLQVALESGLANCPRCGLAHEGLMDWKAFRQPVAVEGIGVIRYWASCPNTGDPILLMLEAHRPG